jgi:uncharacterized protein YprB with RNaseH-like and TPR domain
MKLRAYLDIETTGLSRHFSDITVIGIAIEENRHLQVYQLLEDSLTDKKLINTLKQADHIYTYNGSRFDLPFIRAKFGINLAKEFRHTDLMYNCWDNNLKGGLKVVEQLLYIERKLKGIDGFMAVQLWRDYKNNNDKDALKTLLEYNREDILNLTILRKKLKVI